MADPLLAQYAAARPKSAAWELVRRSTGPQDGPTFLPPAWSPKTGKGQPVPGAIVALDRLVQLELLNWRNRSGVMELPKGGGMPFGWRSNGQLDRQTTLAADVQSGDMSARSNSVVVVDSGMPPD